MAEPLDQAILRIANREGKRGLPMGALVDELVDAGHDEETVELTVWSLLGERRLVPSGFVCRVLKRRDTERKLFHQRTYEFLLCAMPDDDAQLDLPGAK